MKPNQFEDILVYFSESMLGKENEEDILWDLAKNCISKLGFVDCVIYLVDAESNVLVQKAAYGPKNPKDKKLYNPVEIILGQGITGHVAKTGEAEIVNDTSKDHRYIEDDEVRLSEICVPISYEKKIYGVIDCEHPQKNFFTEQHLKMLMAIASLCAVKIKSVRANKELREKQGYLLKVKEEMMELKLSSLNTKLHPHFLFNAINAIQFFVASEDKKAALDHLSIFSKLIRSNLKYLGQDTLDLSEEVQMLEWYLTLQRLRYIDHFEYMISVDNQSEKPGATIPASVTHTLLENIIEFGIYNRLKNEKISIDFTIFDETVVLTIKYVHDEIVSAVNYLPEYRKHIMKWEDQIELLNAAKNYKIKKEIIQFNEKDQYGGKIVLTLPNLT